MQDLVDSEGRREWHEHWRVVAAATVGVVACHLHLYSLGVMIAPLEKQFAWSRAEITSGLLIISIVLCPLSFAVGMAIDRIGPRRIALCGMTMYCAAIAGLSLARQPIWTWWLLWLCVAFGYLLLGPTVWVAAISSFFRASRGLAIAVMLCATGIVSFGAPLITLFLLHRFGWRTAYAGLGGGAAIVALPTLYFFFFGAQDMARVNPSLAKLAVRHGLPIRSSLRSGVFWKLAIAGPIMSTIFTALIVDFVPIFTLAHIPAASAAVIAGLVGTAIVVGRLSGGALNDRLDPRFVAAAMVILPILSCLLLIAFSGSAPIAVIAVLIFGLAAGAELDSLAYLASRFFGSRNFGVLFGILMGLCSLGSGLGPVLASWVYDRTGSYVPVLWGIIPLCLLSSYIFATLPAYPPHNDEPSNQEGVVTPS